MSLHLADGVRFRRILDEGVMLCFEAGEIVGLNGVGARVVELLEGGAADRHALAVALRREHEGAGRTLDADAEADVDRFLDELVELGAVVENPGGRS